ncbi:hypothetical protein HMPREF9999_00293 [Alloprevotella sp. oral taxon 473 str. F0040]|nr:hypothetical protein HMPREF9999_00293 [Alloprevotella sp. oral taxon 473 str. F0040]
MEALDSHDVVLVYDTIKPNTRKHIACSLFVTLLRCPWTGYSYLIHQMERGNDYLPQE